MFIQYHEHLYYHITGMLLFELAHRDKKLNYQKRFKFIMLLNRHVTQAKI